MRGCNRASLYARTPHVGEDRGNLGLPEGYWLDHSDTDLLVLRRPGGTAATYFSAWGATAETIRQAAEADLSR